MVSNDRFRRYLEAGYTFGQINRARAEELVAELVRAGEVQRNQVQDWVDDLVERSRASADALVGMVRDEVKRQLASLGLDSPDEVRKLMAALREQAERIPGLDVVRKAASHVPGVIAKTAPAARARAREAAQAPAAAPKKAAPKKAAATRTGHGAPPQVGSSH